MKYLLLIITLTACGSEIPMLIDQSEGIDCTEQYLDAEDQLAHTFPRSLNLSYLGDAEFYLSGEYMDETFLAAAAEWNDQLGFEAFRAMTVGTGGHIKVYADANLSAGGQTTGTVNNRVIKLHPGVHNDYENVAHELGHSLGLQHENDSTSVMYGGVNGSGSLANTRISKMSRCVIKSARLNGGAS